MEARIQSAHTQRQQATDKAPASVIDGQNNRNISASQQEDERQLGAGGLSVILGQLVAYFSERANADDMDVLSFSVHHMFCRIDFLYTIALPELMHYAAQQKAALSDDSMAHHQSMWTQLRTIKQVLNRIESLCTLLSDTTFCILDTLDLTSSMYSLSAAAKEEYESWLHPLNQERWKHALKALTHSMEGWQQGHQELANFVSLFSQQAPTVNTLPQMDAALSMFLDSAGAIFGDIIPGFRAVSAGDDEAVAALLFDLMQQVDQMLIQVDAIAQPLQTLIDFFALGSR